MSITERLQAVRATLPEGVQLVAISKYHPVEAIREAYNEHVLKIFKNKAQFLVSGLDGASAAVLGASAIGWEIQ